MNAWNNLSVASLFIYFSDLPDFSELEMPFLADSVDMSCHLQMLVEDYPKIFEWFYWSDMGVAGFYNPDGRFWEVLGGVPKIMNSVFVSFIFSLCDSIHARTSEIHTVSFSIAMVSEVSLSGLYMINKDGGRPRTLLLEQMVNASQWCHRVCRGSQERQQG